MAHYKLKKGVFFTEGALRGAILDTNTENVYSVNASAVSIIAGSVENEAYWQQLVGLGLAEECDTPTPLPDLPRLEKITLRFIWFEVVTDDCNESCIHCYAGSMPPSHRRALGLPARQGSSNRVDKLTFGEWCDIISEGYQLGCREGQFIGGEPFLYQANGHGVLDLAEHAISTGYKMVELFTNATLLTDRQIQRIRKLGLRVAVSLYSHDAEVHDSITQTPGSHARTVAALHKLKEMGVPTRVELVAMRQNEHSLPQTQRFIREIGLDGRPPDPLRPKGRGDNSVLKPSFSTVIRYGLITQPNFKASQQSVGRYSSSHSCLAGKIAITDSGDVLPCIFSRNQIIGNVRDESSLSAAMSAPALQRVWNTTKDNVLVCQNCEYRYVCFDCRPLSEAAAQGRAGYLHAPYPRCTYNPYTGEWAKGVWRVNKKGNAFYDSSVESAIQQHSGKRTS